MGGLGSGSRLVTDGITCHIATISGYYEITCPRFELLAAAFGLYHCRNGVHKRDVIETLG